MKAVKKKEITANNEGMDTRKKRNKNIVISLVLAIAIWALMLFVASNIINESEHVTVYRAKIDMIKGTKITSDNMNDMVESVNISVDLIPDGYITDASELVNVFTNREYSARDIITTSGINTERSMTEYIENPIEVSVATNSLDAAVGGILREGDYVNIYSVVNNTNAGVGAQMIIGNGYVTKALNSNGAEIDRSDTVSTATIVNLIIPMAIEKQFTAELLSGTVRLSLIYNPDLANMSKINEAHEDNVINTTEIETVVDGTEEIDIGNTEEIDSSENENKIEADENENEDEESVTIDEDGNTDESSNEANNGTLED